MTLPGTCGLGTEPSFIYLIKTEVKNIYLIVDSLLKSLSIRRSFLPPDRPYTGIRVPGATTGVHVAQTHVRYTIIHQCAHTLHVHV